MSDYLGMPGITQDSQILATQITTTTNTTSPCLQVYPMNDPRDLVPASHSEF